MSRITLVLSEYTFNIDPILKGLTKMKQTVKTLLILALGIMLIPCIAFFKDSLFKVKDKPLPDKVKIYLTEDKTVKTISRMDYLLYSTLASIPMDMSDETIKAQMILQNTYIAREAESPDPSLDGAHISDDETVYQKVFTKEEASGVYDNLDEILKRLKPLAEEVYDTVLTYGGDPVAVAYFERSFGSTESAEDIWGEDISYLTSVDCDTDKGEEASETEISKDDLKKALENQLDISLSDDYDSWIKVIKESKNDTPLKVLIDGQKEMSASELYMLLSLPSQHFTFKVTDEAFVFSTKGSGHLVGFCQSYAEQLASEGKSFEEILNYFYKDCEIKSIK